ncbi:HAD family hydrolase [Halorutilales archaeon Cl-col2-1]
MRLRFFDLFGTLVTVDVDPFDEITEAVASLGVGSNDFKTEYVTVYEERSHEVEIPLTDHVSETLARLGCEVEKEEVRRRVEDIFFDAEIRRVDGAEEVVEKVSSSDDTLTAVVSNTSVEGLVDTALSEAGLRDEFDAVVSSVDVGHRKPSTEPFDEALRQLGVDTEEVRHDVVHVGDSLVDIEGGNKAGFKTCLVDADDDDDDEYANAKSDMAREKANPDYVVTDISEVTEVLRR